MKIIEGLEMRRLGNDCVVIPESGKLVNFNKMIALNPSAAYLWESVAGKEFTAADLRQLLMDHYEVDEATASADAQKLLEDWIEAGVVTE